MNADVEKAVESLGTRFVSTSDGAHEVRVVAKALRDQDAEIARLKKIEEERWSVVATRNAAVMRAEKADALLRDVVNQWPSLSCEAFHHRKADQHSIAEECEPLRRWRALYSCITAHLGAAK